MEVVFLRDSVMGVSSKEARGLVTKIESASVGLSKQQDRRREFCPSDEQLCG